METLVRLDAVLILSRKSYLGLPSTVDRPARDVAEKLGISVNSVYIAKSRILKRLHDEFGELIDGETI